MVKRNLHVLIALIAAIALPVHCFADSMATSGVTAVYDIPTGELVAANLDELEALVDNAENLDFAESSMLTVVVPSNLDFQLDPLEVHGKGQIYSDNFLIQNYSNTDVTVKLENIKYTFVNETDFLSLDMPPEIPFGIRNPSKLKEVYMLLHYENRDYENFVITTKEKSETADIILAAAEYDEDGNFVELNADSTLIFSFTGIVNHLPAIEWEDKDFSVSIEYTLIPDEFDESDEADQEVDENDDANAELSPAEDTALDFEEQQDVIIAETADIPQSVETAGDESDSDDVISKDEESDSAVDYKENETATDKELREEENITEPKDP